MTTGIRRAVMTCCAIAVGLVVMVGRPGEAGAAPAWTDLRIWRLGNGLKVVVQEDYRTPFVSMSLKYNAGSRDDPPGREGLAAITMRMMLRATAHVREGDYRRILRRSGALKIDDDVGVDLSTEGVTVPSNRVSVPLWLWSDQMGFFVMRADERILSEAREFLQEEWREKVANARLGILERTMQERLFPRHPYGHAGVTWPADFPKMTLDDVRRFHQDHFAPDNAVLAIVGAVDADYVIQQVEMYFGQIPPAHHAQPAPVVPAPLTNTVVEMEAAIPEDELHIAWLSPAHRQHGDYELEVAAKLLAGKRNSMLGWRLEDELKIATSVGAIQESSKWGSAFGISITMARGHKAEEGLGPVDEVLRELSTESRTPEAVAMAAADQVLHQFLDLDVYSVKAESLASCAIAKRYPECLPDYFKAVYALTPEQIRATVRDLLGKNRLVFLVHANPSAPICGKVISERKGPAQ